MHREDSFEAESGLQAGTNPVRFAPLSCRRRIGFAVSAKCHKRSYDARLRERSLWFPKPLGQPFPVRLRRIAMLCLHRVFRNRALIVDVAPLFNQRPLRCRLCLLRELAEFDANGRALEAAGRFLEG